MHNELQPPKSQGRDVCYSTQKCHHVQPRLIEICPKYGKYKLNIINLFSYFSWYKYRNHSPKFCKMVLSQKIRHYFSKRGSAFSINL